MPRRSIKQVDEIHTFFSQPRGISQEMAEEGEDKDRQTIVD